MTEQLENWRAAGFALYIHWPFCAAKCPYCDFNSHVSNAVDYDVWQAAFLTELRVQHQRTQGRKLSSIFFGGGTPSLMPPSLVAAILNEIARLWGLDDSVEITLEANPSSVESDNFQALSNAGVNRLSLGVQALNDEDLQRLGRLHNCAEALTALEVALAHFNAVSLDLIYAREFQTAAAWRAELTRAIALGTKHLSLYQLTIEPKTAFHRLYTAGKLTGLPDADRAADLYEITQELCGAANFTAYEVSNHARAGAQCQHNLIYWRGGDWLGIGPGAHGRLTLNGARIATTAPAMPKDWLDAVAQNGTACIDSEIITAPDIAREYALMSLRLKEGCDYARLINLGGAEVLNEAAKTQQIKDGLLRQTNSHIIATDSGRMILNTILAELLT